MSAGFRIAYVIFAHHKPYQLERLLKRMDDGQAGFFLHIDRGSDIAEFKDAMAAVSHSPITLVKRVGSIWGRIGEVKCALNAMAAVLDSRVRYDYVVSLSGQDYPIKPNREIISFFEQNRKLNFVEHERMPCSFWFVDGGDGGMWRIERYHLRLFGKPTMYPEPPKPHTFKGNVFRIVRDLLCGLRFRTPRRFPKYLIPYGGTGSLNLSREAVRYVLDFVRNHPDYLRFHRNTASPGEIFFHSILLNSREDLRDSIVNDSLRYMKWVRGNHPEILTTRELPALRSANSLFARKFDMDVDSEVLDVLDSSAREESSNLRQSV